MRIPNGDGAYDRYSLHTSDLTEAIREAESKLAAARAGVSTDILWQHLVEVYRKEHFPHLREGTRDTYDWAITALTPILYDKYVRSIDGPTMDKFVKARFEAGLSSAGIRSELAVLSSILGWAEGKMHIGHNPVPRFIKANKVRLRRGEPRVRWLTVPEELRVLELLRQYAVDSDKGPDARLNLMAAVIVAIDTGLRLAELRQMQWSEIQFAPKAQVWVPKDRAKSRKDRWVPLLPRAAKLLWGTREKALAAAGGDVKKMCRWVFPSDDNTGPRINLDKALRQFAGTYPDKKRKRLIDGPVLKDGMAPFSWHDLRRTWAAACSRARGRPS